MRSGDLLNPLCRHSPGKEADAAPLFARLSMAYYTYCKRDVSGRCCRRIFRPLPRFMVTSSALKAMAPGYEFMMLFTARHVILRDVRKVPAMRSSIANRPKPGPMPVKRWALMQERR